jgi:hypothetical protein
MSVSRPVKRGPFRLMGLALFANGVLGLALVGIALGALGPLLTRASVAADSAGDSLAAAAQALDQTSTSFDGFSKSLDDAKTSSAHASQLLNDAATTSSQLADGMAISLLGAQPFLAISQSFRRNTDELRGVSAIRCASFAIAFSSSRPTRPHRPTVGGSDRSSACSPTGSRSGSGSWRSCRSSPG